jgi:putative ABC transport system permease protein
LRGENYAKPEQQQRYFQALSDRISSLSGVQAVTLGSGLPLTGSTEVFGNVNIAGRPPLGPHGVGVIIHAVEPNFFDVLHVRSLAGRTLNQRDTETSPRVAVINRNAAHTIFGSENPVGKVLEYLADERRGVPLEAPVQIVGVCESTQEFGAMEIPFDVIYVPFSQHPTPGANLVVAATIPRGALLGAIRDAAYALDKDQPLYDVKTVDQLIGDSLRGARFDTILVGCLAAVALALVSVGIFGTVAYFVQQRTQEFGIRLALGATPAHILRQAIGRAYNMGILGLLTGIAVALTLGRILGSALYLVPHEHTGMLYGVKIYDPLSMSVASVVLLAVLFLASFIPARRATRVDPMMALRYE